MTNDGKCLSYKELLCGSLVTRLASIDIKSHLDISP